MSIENQKITRWDKAREWRGVTQWSVLSSFLLLTTLAAGSSVVVTTLFDIERWLDSGLRRSVQGYFEGYFDVSLSEIEDFATNADWMLRLGLVSALFLVPSTHKVRKEYRKFRDIRRARKAQQ